MTSTIEPLVVFDARDERWRGDSHILAWCRSEGIDPEQVYRLEVYLVDCPFARVYDDYLRRDPYDVILSSLPPEASALPEEQR
ncbi:hypothetical protein ACIBHX_01840 [Nonomuraea sp. NPDC050536]|uniref:hypothetical protein n=1 Tax=Nonomuraea sp. NPDC050536 TaxID=3364366 RepID=UPI0037C8C8B6